MLIRPLSFDFDPKKNSSLHLTTRLRVVWEYCLIEVLCNKSALYDGDVESELPLNESPVTVWAFVRFVARVDFPVTIEGRWVGQLLFADFALDDNLPVGTSSLGSFWRTAAAGTGLRRWRLHRGGLRGRRAGNRL